MRKKVAALALGISLLALGATVANAQFGKLLKAMKDAATELQVPTNVATPSTSPTNTLEGRWVPVAESCAGDEGVSERMIELKGKDMIQAFGSCEFPAAISSRSAYNGSMSCNDEEGGEHNSSVSIAIQQNGMLLWRDREGSGPVTQSTYKKCSPAPKFPDE